MAGKWSGSKNDAADKRDIAKWLSKLAKNDARYGRDSKHNPNNKPNGK